MENVKTMVATAFKFDTFLKIPAGGMESALRVKNNGSRIFFSTEDNIYCLNENGTIVWKQPVDSEVSHFCLSHNEQNLARALFVYELLNMFHQ